MGWREGFEKNDISVDRLGYWWAVLGPTMVLAVVMSAIAAGFTSIAEYGWGAIIFAGVGAACLIVFAASALMVSWRYFNPLPKQQTTSGEGREVATGDLSSRLAEAERGIAQNKVGLNELRTRAEATARDLTIRVIEAERSIARNKAGLEEFRTKAVASTQDISSRLAEIERGLAQNKAGLGEVRTKATLLTRSLRARDAQSMIQEADQVVMSTHKRLLEAAYPDEATWADDYAVWEKAMRRIDDLMSQWTHQHHEPFLDIRAKELEAGAPPPEQIKSDANATRYKTARLAQSSYADKREGLFGYFTAIIGDV
jgi:hypothetical protein